MCSSKERLDVLLVELGYFPSRERARAAILSGLVLVNDEVADKVGKMVSADASIRLKRDPIPYVSRGGLKLERALDIFGVVAHGRTCLDVGASTGGFTDVLLQRGARRVYSVDVGYGQLDWGLRQDPRVVVMERTNARYLKPEMFPYTPDLASVDVSFISSCKVLPAIYSVTSSPMDLLLLVKPQFEAGKGKVKKGVVRDPGEHIEVLEKVKASSERAGFVLVDATFSPIKGPAGNIEFWFHFIKGELSEPVDLKDTVMMAHRSLRGGDL